MQAKYSWQPKYVSEFQCDGSQCNSKCCSSAWSIEIDNETYNKYKRIKNRELRDKICNAIFKDENKNRYLIKLNEQNSCPLVCKDHLCHIQRTLGAEYLSFTCQHYPRKLFRYSSFNIKVLTISCPLVAEQVIFSPDSMSLIKDTNVVQHPGWQLLNQKTKVNRKYADEIIENTILGAISLLQNKVCPLKVRFLALGLFLEQVDALIEQNNAAVKIAQLAVDYNSEYFQDKIKAYCSPKKFRSAENQAIMNDLLTILDIGKPLQERQLYGYRANHFCVDYPEEYKKINQDYNQALENLWVQEFLFQGYPFSYSGTFLHNFFIYIVSYVVWEILLYDYCYDHKGTVNKTEILDLFYNGPFVKTT